MNRKKWITINVQQVWQTSNTADISYQIDELLDAFCQLGVYAYPAILDNMRSMCYADRANTMVVNSDGEIFKCTALDFSKETGECNIFSDNIKEELKTHFVNRLNKRFENSLCLSCNIFPLCLGGCYKSVKSNPVDYCIYGDKTGEKEKLIMTIIKDRIRRDIIYGTN